MKKARSVTDFKSGIYILEIEAKVNFKLDIKKFTGLTFPAGWYYYVGSAQKNFHHRVLRHIRKEKKIHWHIDHLTTNKKIDVKSIYIFENKPKQFETDLVKDLVDNIPLKYFADGFGNSDDPVCKSHLLYSRQAVAYSHFISRYQSTVRFIPSSMEIF